MERQFISPEVTVKGFNKCCTSNMVDEIDDMLWNGGKEDGNIRNVRKMKALTMKMETVTFFFLWCCDPTRVMASSFLRFSRSHDDDAPQLVGL
jgi:hypothetical protein